MSTKIAINGFGRIGPLALRAMLERHQQKLTVVAVNDIANLKPTRLCSATINLRDFPRPIETARAS